jgi:hypothetical protein
LYFPPISVQDNKNKNHEKIRAFDAQEGEEKFLGGVDGQA